MASMSNDTRSHIIEAAKRGGFSIQLKVDGTDLYDKNLVFRSGLYESYVIIHRMTGIDQATGSFRYLKVAVHPDSFKPGLINPATGIEDYINAQSKVNRHHGSNYKNFPANIPGTKEPYGKCYKVFSLDALTALLSGLESSLGHIEPTK